MNKNKIIPGSQNTHKMCLTSVECFKGMQYVCNILVNSKTAVLLLV